MATLKIKNEQGGWDDIPAIRGRDGAIQYTAGANIEISSDNVISAIGLEGTVTRDDVEEMIGEAVPTKTSDLDNDAGFITDTDVPSKTSDLTNDSGFITSDDVPTSTSDLINDAGFITVAQVPAEQEPAFNGSVAKNITQTDINNWNGKQAPIVFNSTYNATTNKAATMNDMPFVPTKLSDLTNDSGYALRSELPTVPIKLSDLTNDTGFITSSSLPTKTSDLTNDSNFATLSDIPTVPTKVSDLTNDSGFITSNSLPTKTSDLTNDSGYITSSSLPTKVSDLTNDSGYITSSDIPTIPTKVSDLTNDSGYITSSALPTKTSDLTNDSGFITDEEVPTNTSDLINDNYVLMTESGSSYSFTNLYAALNKTLVKEGTVDFNQIHAFRLQKYDRHTYNGQMVDRYSKPWSIASIENAATKVYDSRLGSGHLVAGTAGDYDTVIYFEDGQLYYESGTASYYIFGYSSVELYINKANIMSGTGGTSSFALMAGSSSINVAKG